MESEAASVRTVSVDRELCLSAAVCLAFHVYELDDESKAVLLTANGLNSDDPVNALARVGQVAVADLITEGRTEAEMRELVLESARLCPFNAIIVKDAEGKQLWPRA